MRPPPDQDPDQDQGLPIKPVSKPSYQVPSEPFLKRGKRVLEFVKLLQENISLLLGNLTSFVMLLGALSNLGHSYFHLEAITKSLALLASAMR
jgi:hypothetical protein